MASGGSEGSSPSGWYAKFKSLVKSLKRQVLAVYYALEEPEVGWLPRSIAIIAIGYALSPLDLIPDFIPVLGLVDDLIILPCLLWLAIWLIPEEVMAKATHRAETEPLRLASNWVAAVLFFALWNIFFGWLAWIVIKHFGSPDIQSIEWWVVGGVVGVAVVVEAIWAALHIRSENRNKVAQVQGGDVEQVISEPLLVERSTLAAAEP